MGQNSFHDELLRRCEETLRGYKDWNSYLENKHNEGELLYLRSVRIPESSPRRARFSNWNKVSAPIQSIPIVLDQIQTEYDYQNAVKKTGFALRSPRLNSIRAYRLEQAQENVFKRDPRTVGDYSSPDGVSLRVHKIPNSVSLKGVTISEKKDKSRDLDVRKKMLETSRISRGEHVPKQRGKRDRSYLEAAAFHNRLNEAKMDIARSIYLLEDSKERNRSIKVARMNRRSYQ